MCTNTNIKNETESLISRILDDIWIEAFSYLDIKTLAFMMVSCKKMADLANDDETRERYIGQGKIIVFSNFYNPHPH